jgi:hypothetical protein
VQLSRLWAAAAAAAAVAAIAVVASGNGSPRRPATGPHATPSPSSSSTSPIDAEALTSAVPCQPSAAGALADRDAVRALGAVAAVNCIDREQTYEDGEWTVEVRRISATGIAAFLDAIDRPDEPPTNGSCTADLRVDPAIALVNPSGGYLFPRFPRDACSQPMQDLAKRITDWQEVSTRRVRQQFTRAELDGHCEPAWKNMLAMDPGEHPSEGGPVLARAAAGEPLHACLYRTGADSQVGEFERAITVAPADADRLRTALAAPGTAGECAPQASFAVVQALGHGEVTVELGGCWRVLRDDLEHSGIGTADAAVVQTVLG